MRPLSVSNSGWRGNLWRLLLFGLAVAYANAVTWARAELGETAATVVAFGGLFLGVAALAVYEVRRRRTETRVRDVARGRRGRLTLSTRPSRCARADGIGAPVRHS